MSRECPVSLQGTCNVGEKDTFAGLSLQDLGRVCYCRTMWPMLTDTACHRAEGAALFCIFPKSKFVFSRWKEQGGTHLNQAELTRNSGAFTRSIIEKLAKRLKGPADPEIERNGLKQLKTCE